ncbi:MAG: hypothetical protein ACRDNJ_15075 [Solirubrobacteraceae bacterium]
MPDYEWLATLLERELQLAGERRFDELAQIAGERAALQRELPAVPPPGAREALERCTRLQKRVEIELVRVREALLAELDQVGRAQRAAHGYAPPRHSGRRVTASA